MKKLLVSLMLVPFLSRMAPAQPCAPNNAHDVLTCVLSRHPDLIRAEADFKSASMLRAAARQRPNPEVDADFTHYDAESQPALKTEAAYFHTFELGNKRGWRVQEAQMKQMAAEARLKRVRDETTIETVLKLHRLRQLAGEERTMDEAINTFQTIVKSYHARPRRSAEQEASLHIFELAAADYRIRRSMLLQEKNSLLSWFSLTAQIPVEQLLKVLPAAVAQWPSVTDGPGVTAAWRQEAAAELASAEAGIGQARSNAWPDLKAGPRVDSVSGRGQNILGLGAAVSLGLPLYHRNRGAKELARAETERAEVNLAQKDRELAAERQRLTAIYRDTVDAHQNAPTIEKVERYHERMERESERGLISPALIIEAHRQMADYARTRHDLERRALEALWTLYALDGQIAEARL